MDNQVKMVITPKKSIKYYCIRNLWMFIIYLVIIIMSFVAKAGLEDLVEDSSTFLNGFIGKLVIIAGILTVLTYIYITLKMYINTRIIKYVFYDTYVKYVDDFWNKAEKDISYDKIAEVSMQQPILDRLLKTGTIYLKTPVENAIGIYMNYVDNPQDVTDSIRKIMENKF